MGAISPLYATPTPTPNVIPISDGSGTLNDWVTGGSGGSSWIPLVDGSEPPNFITDGAGVLILIPFTP